MLIFGCCGTFIILTLERQLRTIVVGFCLTLIISKSQGQCSFLDGKFEAGHSFKKNVRHGLDPQKALEKDYLISLVKIDSIGLRNPSWSAAVQFHDKPVGQVDVEFEFQNKVIIKIRGQRPKFSELDIMYLMDNELIFPIDKTDIELIMVNDLVSVRIKTEQELVTFFPQKNLLKQMTKCLM